MPTASSYQGGHVVPTPVVMKSSIFWNVTPCSVLLKIKLNKKQALLVACFMLVSCLAYSSTLKMEAT
jgi:hypothetical protein